MPSASSGHYQSVVSTPLQRGLSFLLLSGGVAGHNHIIPDVFM